MIVKEIQAMIKLFKEDLRHKIWMLAMSVLGNLIAGPMLYLMAFSKKYMARMNIGGALARQVVQNVVDSFSEYLPVSGGVIAIIGAMIVGFASFRYVYHRNQADTFDSLPVSRAKSFAVNYITSFLIWLVPYVVCTLVTCFLGLNDLNKAQRILGTLPEGISGSSIFTASLCNIGICVVVFLLVYNLALVAVMVSGNVINTDVAFVTTGVGVIGVYGLIYVFMSGLDTFVGYSWSSIGDALVHASPLAAAVMLIVHRTQQEVTWTIALDIAVALLLGAVAFMLYLHRRSEMAEGGLKNAPLKRIIELIISFAGGCLGFLLFSELSDVLGWGIAGSVIASAVLYGTCEVIYDMDFKSFYRAFIRKNMIPFAVISIVLPLLVSLGSRYDWFGYDTYLPRKSAVAEVGISVASLQASSTQPQDVMDYTHFTGEPAYAFLEEASRTQKHLQNHKYLDGSTDKFTSVTARVKLTSGREYYREYEIYADDSAATEALIHTPEYVQAGCKIIVPEFVAGDYVDSLNIDSVRTSDFYTVLSTNGDTHYIDEQDDSDSEDELFFEEMGIDAKQFVIDLINAYNADLDDNPMAAFGRAADDSTDKELLYRLNLTYLGRYSGRSGYQFLHISVYDGMDRTLEVLNRLPIVSGIQGETSRIKPEFAQNT